MVGGRHVASDTEWSEPMMGKALVLLAKLQSDRKGVTALEYGVIASVVVVAVAAALTKLDFTTFFTGIMSKVNTAAG